MNIERTAKRAYRMASRAEASEATRERILAAATALFTQLTYDEVSLDAVARRAEVSLPTVLRKFGSKDELFVSCGKGESQRESSTRTVRSGDVRGVARMLAR